ncbi:hypothetical protein CFN78_07100 [Amycolatopsis antarctica]|uniref:Uncharacterized protein n=1 Tax=Amycolatopsis antarctica TaxID=1854586 RepID=A0A263D9Z4_9PSEU|nr:hypothetical protein CFN78_07100 [Amycolatopsis antarctica]
MRTVGGRRWCAFAAAVLGAVSLLLTWTSLTAGDPQLADALAELPSADVHRDVWASGFFAWAPMLLLIVTGLAVAVFGGVRAARAAGLPQLWLIAAAVVAVLAVLGWFTMGWQFGTEQRALLAESGVAFAAGAGRWLGSAAAALSLATAVLDVRAARAAKPGSGRRARRRR